MSQLENNTSTLQTLLSTIETMEVMPNSVEQAIPTIEISSGGLITTRATQGAGVVAAGTKTNTKQMTIQAAKTVTPSTNKQTAVASGVYTTGAVTVEAMPIATQATPSISVNSAGLITANATQSAGYVSEGSKSATKQLTTKGATTITPSTSSQTAVASGVYTTGAITVAAMPTGSVGNPSITVNSSGLITATAAVNAGYVDGTDKSGTKQLTTKAAATITPGTSNKTIASGTYLTGTQTIAGDADLVAGNIKKGVNIFGVTGSMEPKEFTINATVESGATVTATSGSTTVTGTSNGTCALKVPRAGTWTVKATTQLDEWNDELETSNSKSVVTVDTHSTSLTFFRAYINVIAPVGTEVSCTNGTKTYTATVTLDTVQFRVLTTGSWTISATLDGDSDSTVVTVSEALTYNLALLGGVSYTLNNNAWSVIKEISDAGTAANYWAVGDTHEVTINGTVGQTTFNNLSVYAFILGFNHNSSIEGTNRIHFQIGKTAQTGGKDICLVDSEYGSDSYKSGYFSMINFNSNSGGWNSSKMRTVLLGSSYTPSSPLSGSLLAALPSDLRDVMKSCTKYSDNTGGGSDTASYVTSTTDYLWLLAEYEVFGTRTSANSAEQIYQQQYTYYANGNSRVKYRHSSTSSAAVWWLRSTKAESRNAFCAVNAGGNFNYNYALYSYGVAPAFCV